MTSDRHDCFRLGVSGGEEFRKNVHPTNFPYILVFLFIIKYDLDNTYIFI
jgi:hypothetical protein